MAEPGNGNGGAIVKAPIVVGERGLKLQTFDDIWRFANLVVASGLAPKEIVKPETAAIAIQYGMEIGIPPLRSLQSIAVINGRPSLWGDTMLGLCIGHSSFDGKTFREWYDGTWGEDAFKACCQVCRVGREPVVSEFSIADAKRAGLWGKAGPWQQYPRRMLKMRARSWALRDEFPDVLGGFAMAEEMMDVRPVDAEVIASKTPETGVAGLKAKLAAPGEPPPAEQPAPAPVDRGSDGNNPAVVEPPTPIDSAEAQVDVPVEKPAFDPDEPPVVTKSGLRVPAASLADKHRKRMGD